MRRLAFAVEGGSGVATRHHREASGWFMACNLARLCALVALMVQDLCESRLCSDLRGTGIAAERLAGLLSRLRKFSAVCMNRKALEDVSRWMKKPSPSDRSA